MEPVSEATKMEISPETLRNLNTIRKWTMFLSVIGFIVMGLLIAMILATGTFLTFFKLKETGPENKDILMIIVLVTVAIVFFFSVLFLFRFSRLARDAVHKHDVRKLDEAFKNIW